MYQQHVIAYIEYMLAAMVKDLESRGYELTYHVQRMESDMSRLDDPEFKYLIIEKRSQKIVGYAKTLKAAARSVDRRDSQYGGYGYTFMDRLRYINSQRSTAA